MCAVLVTRKTKRRHTRMKSVLLRVARGTSRVLSKACSPCVSSLDTTRADQPAARPTPFDSSDYSLHLEGD